MIKSMLIISLMLVGGLYLNGCSDNSAEAHEREAATDRFIAVGNECGPIATAPLSTQYASSYAKCSAEFNALGQDLMLDTSLRDHSQHFTKEFAAMSDNLGACQSGNQLACARIDWAISTNSKN